MGKLLIALTVPVGLLTAGVVALPLLFVTAGTSFRLSSSLSQAPPGLIALAEQAGASTEVDPNVLLAISKVECSFGQCRTGASDALVPADIRAHIDAAALQAGGRTALPLQLSGGRRIGDWVNPQAVESGQHAMGFMQFLPSSWRTESQAAPGRPQDPYDPFQAMTAAGSYLHRLITGAEVPARSLHDALAVYGGNSAYADEVLSLAQAPPAGGGLPPSTGSVLGGRVLTVTGQQPVLAGVPPGGWPDPYPYGQCTWWAARNRQVPGDLQNAWQWLSNAGRRGYSTSASPQVGAIVVYGQGGGYSEFGHVGIVVEVRAGGFVVSEMNYVGWAIVDQRLSPWPDAHVEGFVT